MQRTTHMTEATNYIEEYLTKTIDFVAQISCCSIDNFKLPFCLLFYITVYVVLKMRTTI